MWTWKRLLMEFDRRLQREMPTSPDGMERMPWKEWLEYCRRRLRRETAGRWVLWHVAMVKRNMLALGLFVAMLTTAVLWLHLRIERLEERDEDQNENRPTPLPDDDGAPITWGR